MPRPAIIIAAFAIASVQADIYMHNPPGSNDRNRERNENRNNGNRLFDSQNNDKGGYPWRGNREVRSAPDPAQYYEDSMLVLEWTAQHGCGDNPSTNCAFTVQYACEDTLPGLRDGYPGGALEDSDNNNGDYNPPYQQASFNANNDDGTDRISANTAQNTEYGMHEDLQWYQEACQGTARNQGLYTADQNLNNNDATSTRQNPNGNRNGFECPEERDYYPYWLSTPWRDVAVLTSNTDWCEYYQENSANVKDTYRCQNGGNNQGTTEATCNGQWVKTAARGGGAPDCQLAPASRQNHLGNSSPIPNEDIALETADLGGGTAAHYEWTVPELDVLNTSADSIDCVVRYRYNISTEDYPSFAGMTAEGGEFVDSDYNCDPDTDDNDNDPNATPEQSGCQNRLTDGNRPLYNRPYVQVFPPDVQAPKVSIAINTDQAGRTFQDRSHVFRIVKRPSEAGAQKIWNVNTRGRRGNIVQSYPAVEYGLIPAELTTEQGDLLHFQFHGSDFNAARNPNNGEGWQYSDRINMIEASDLAQGIPLPYEMQTFFSDADRAREFALLDSQENLSAGGHPCETFEDGDDNENNDPRNCGKMNAASATWVPTSGSFDDGAGLIEVEHERQTFNFVTTRNNNFSNRSQKWTLHVTGLIWWEIMLIVLGVLIFIGLVNAAFCYFLRSNGYNLCLGYQYFCCPCLRSTLEVESIDDIMEDGKKSRRRKGKSSRSGKSRSSKKASGGDSQGGSRSSKKSKKRGETELMGF